MLLPLTFLVLMCGELVVVCEAKSEDVKQFLKGELQEFGKAKSFSCKCNSLSYLMSVNNFAGNVSLQRYCTLHALVREERVVSNLERSWLWTFLGTLYKESGSSKKHLRCQKEAIKLGGRLILFKKWDFIGPFPIGKLEVDGDPVAEYGVDKAIHQRWHKDFCLFSELVKDGIVKWTEIPLVPAKGVDVIRLNPRVDWTDLMAGLQSGAITEWQGWLVTEFAVADETADFLVQFIGVNTFYIDNSIMNGDIYGSSMIWYPITLNYGIHLVKAFVRAKVTATLLFQIKPKAGHSDAFYPPLMVPNLIDDNWFSGYISFPVLNLNMDTWLEIKAAKLTSHDLPFTDINVALLNDQPIAPGQVMLVDVKLWPTEAGLSHYRGCSKDSYTVVLSIVTNREFSTTVAIDFHCRSSRESFLFTYVDYDGSVQNAAAIKPFETCSLDACPVLLTLHGTGVSPASQADSYKRWMADRFHFGVEKVWVLAPSRHGAHNWEGGGELTALFALKSLAQLTRGASWLAQAADDQALIIAGHSMGGHGAWQLATHHPDIAIAVVANAGWLKKENYGDDNAFYRHDLAASHTEPSIKFIQEACTAENDVDKQATNLKGVPVMIRVGQDDKTVHPFYSRRMLRLLHQCGVNVTYQEVPGKQHWWWDTNATNDGGVMNDPDVRQFVVGHVLDYERRMQQGYCLHNGNDEKRKYFGDQTAFQSYTIIVYNPVSFRGAHGIRVLQQVSPFRKSTVEVTRGPSTLSLATRNVLRLELYEPRVRCVGWLSTRVQIDEQDVDLPVVPSYLCLRQRWVLCEEQSADFETDAIRGPATYGPARRVAEKPFVIIIGTDYPGQDLPLLIKSAVYLANLFHLLSYAQAYVIRDSEVQPHMVDGRNILLVGDHTQNTWLKALTSKSVVTLHSDGASIGNCTYRERLLSAVYMVPHGRATIALVIAGASVEAVQVGLHLGKPTIPPMARSPFSNMVPDYVLMSSSVLGRGSGGILCAGFLDNDWKYRSELSSCAC